MERTVNWDKTARGKQRTDSDEMFQGRPIIGRDKPINGGVYLGEHAREAIVVDFAKDKSLQELYRKAKIRATVGNTIARELVLKSVYDVVKEAMRPSAEGVDAVVKQFNAQNDQKILLGCFIDAGVGVCRHHALACAALLERFKAEKLIRGSPSVDRNSNYLGGHAWCRYTNSIGEVYILDVSQEKIGRLKDLSGDTWPYRRPGE